MIPASSDGEPKKLDSDHTGLIIIEFPECRGFARNAKSAEFAVASASRSDLVGEGKSHGGQSFSSHVESGNQAEPPA